MQTSDASRPRFRVSKALWAGLSTLVIGTGPLVVTMLLASAGLTADPNPNPVGFGILAFLTFWPGVILTVIGAALSVQTWMHARRRASLPVQQAQAAQDPDKPD